MTSGVVLERVAASRDAALGARLALAAGSAWQVPEAELLDVCGQLARLRSAVEAAYLAAVA